MTPSPASLLFVCTGNICRSPMAAGIMQKLLEEKGPSLLTVRSAGTHALVGSGPAPEAVEVCRELGVDISQHRARQLDRNLILASRMILVMEAWHVDEVLNRAPSASFKTFLLGSFSPRNLLVEIPDPIGKSIPYYQSCAGIITESVEGLYDSRFRSPG